MTHEEQRVWLIRYMLDEDPYYQDFKIPDGEQEQKNLRRALMNVREPKPISEEFLEIEDEYLKNENLSAGVTDIANLTPTEPGGTIYLWQGDITTLRVGAITNPANEQLCGCFRALHSCADNIIHSKAGTRLRLRCASIMSAQGHNEPTGRAKITPAYNLPCDYVLHTVGPIVSSGTSFASPGNGFASPGTSFASQGRPTRRQEELLASCYTSCLELAAENGVESIAFCCISTGVFMFPNQRAAEIAVKTVRDWLAETGSAMKVVFNVYKDEDLRIYQELLGIAL